MPHAKTAAATTTFSDGRYPLISLARVSVLIDVRLLLSQTLVQELAPTLKPARKSVKKPDTLCVHDCAPATGYFLQLADIQYRIYFAPCKIDAKPPVFVNRIWIRD